MVFAIRQAPRLDAAEVVAGLAREGYAIEILSGDRAGGGRGGRARARLHPFCRRLEAGRQDRPAQGPARGGPPRADGRRRPQRRAGARRRQRLDLADLGGASDPGPGRRRLPRRPSRADRRGAAYRAQGEGADDREPVDVGDLQFHRGADRHSRLRDAADRRAGDVGFVDPGHRQRAQGAQGEGARMNVLVFLVPIAIGLGLIGLFAFLWAMKSGQFDDLDGAAWRAISDDDLPERETPKD